MIRFRLSRAVICSSDLFVSRAAILEAEQREPSGACMRANNSCCRPILFVYTWLYFGEGPHGCSFGGRPSPWNFFLHAARSNSQHASPTRHRIIAAAAGARQRAGCLWLVTAHVCTAHSKKNITKSARRACVDALVHCFDPHRRWMHRRSAMATVRIACMHAARRGNQHSRLIFINLLGASFSR